MFLTIHPEAELELEEAIAYYDSQRQGLGIALSEAVGEAGARILASPMAWATIAPGIRRALVGRFPYSILYTHRAADIFILAVMHQKRKPGYWKSRLEDA